MSAEIPYDPPPRKYVSQQRMREILAKHSQTPPPVCNTSSPTPRMKWRKVTEDTIESNLGYSVLRCVEGGKPTGRYLAFLVEGEKRTVVGGFDSGIDARTACDAFQAKRA